MRVIVRERRNIGELRAIIVRFYPLHREQFIHPQLFHPPMPDTSRVRASHKLTLHIRQSGPPETGAEKGEYVVFILGKFIDEDKGKLG